MSRLEAHGKHGKSEQPVQGISERKENFPGTLLLQSGASCCCHDLAGRLRACGSAAGFAGLSPREGQSRAQSDPEWFICSLLPLLSTLSPPEGTRDPRAVPSPAGNGPYSPSHTTALHFSPNTRLQLQLLLPFNLISLCWRKPLPSHCFSPSHTAGAHLFPRGELIIFPCSCTCCTQELWVLPHL